MRDWVEKTAQHIFIRLPEERRILSSAVLNGGWTRARYLLNLKVSSNGCSENPENTLADYSHLLSGGNATVGMMTAASMNSLRVTCTGADGVEILVAVTAGLSNARRAGDHAEVRHMYAMPPIAGTINIVVLCSAALRDSAMAEALMLVSEAKAAALQQAGITSPVSGLTATGTGTDSVAIVSGPDIKPGHEQGQELQAVRYCGKHVLFGEILANLVIEALLGSIGKQQVNYHRHGQ